MLSDLLLIFGVAVLSLALRSFGSPWLHKLGAVGVLATSFLIGLLLGGSWVVGVLCVASWLFLPWLDLLTRIRRLSLPVERRLRARRAPHATTFPSLGELTEEIEGEGFEAVDDVGWDWDEHQQFFRLFYKADERLQAAICLVDQPNIAFYYLSISARGHDGTLWTTWNYPFSYSLRLAPQWRVRRVRGDQTFLQILEEHRQGLRRHGIATDALQELTPVAMQEAIQNDLRAQLSHNLAKGLLTQNGAGEVRYSWRGLLFLWWQFLRDLVRLS